MDMTPIISNTVRTLMSAFVMKNAINTLRSRGANDEDIATFLNTKKIPSKCYPVQKWNADMVSQLMKS